MSLTRSTASLAALMMSVSLLPATAMAGVGEGDGNILPRAPEPFRGALAPTVEGFAISVPSPVRAPKGAPNILLVMTDDVGFASAGTFGGPIPTPNLDRLAARGLKYNQFHTTAMCSPTRASLLTGRNHHAVGSGTIVETATPYPGYSSVMPRSAATIARILRDNGYNTAMFGKHHNVPVGEMSAAGPFDRWPTGLGFDYFYGFVGSSTDQFVPALYQNTSPVEAQRRSGEYILDRDLADRAITWIHNQKAAAPEKPFFIYYAPGSAHAPQQAPADWIAKFRGQFDQGWDRLRDDILARQKRLGIVPANTDLSVRPAQIPAWESLSEDEKRVNARYMEVYAAMLAYQDAQFGRILDELDRMGLSDNTLVVFIEGDNGGAAQGGIDGTLNEGLHSNAKPGDEPDAAWLARHLDMMGGPKTYEVYPVGWALAMDTPFPWIKQIASHLGGVRNGLVVSWPARIKAAGEVRPQYHHVIDIMPTLLEAAHIPAPTKVDGIPQQRIDGTSMTYSFDASDAPSTRHTQYYELFGNRGLYHNGWLANTTPRNMPWDAMRMSAGSDVTTYAWELYDLNTDFSQAHDLAAKEPERLKKMKALFDAEARRNAVYPIQDSGGINRILSMAQISGGFRSHYVFWGKDIRLPPVPAPETPSIFALPFSIQADIDVPKNADGVIVAAGSALGGWSFYLKDGKPVAYASEFPGQAYRVAGKEALRPGANSLRFVFEPKGKGGTMTISVNDMDVARGEIAVRPHSMSGIGETFDIGRDTNAPVSEEYDNEGVFAGAIKKVEIDLKRPTGTLPPAAAPSSR